MKRDDKIGIINKENGQHDFYRGYCNITITLNTSERKTLQNTKRFSKGEPIVMSRRNADLARRTTRTS